MYFYGVASFVVCPFPAITIGVPAPIESCALFASPIAVDSPCLAADVAPALTASGFTRFESRGDRASPA